MDLESSIDENCQLGSILREVRYVRIRNNQGSLRNSFAVTYLSTGAVDARFETEICGDEIRLL
jgi:hypothetical protein